MQAPQFVHPQQSHFVRADERANKHALHRSLLYGRRVIQHKRVCRNGVALRPHLFEAKNKLPSCGRSIWTRYGGMDFTNLQAIQEHDVHQATQSQLCPHCRFPWRCTCDNRLNYGWIGTKVHVIFHRLIHIVVHSIVYCLIASCLNMPFHSYIVLIGVKVRATAYLRREATWVSSLSVLHFALGGR